MPTFKWPLGYEARDKIRGFVGVITVRAQHLTGCNRYWLEPPVDKDGKMQEGQWFDEHTLEVTGKTPVLQSEDDTPSGGAPG